MSSAPTPATPATPAGGGLVLDDWFARELPELHRRWAADVVPDPRLVVANRPLARELGIDPDWLASPEGTATLVGADVPDGATPVAQAYAGHQFGGYSPRLGDGRALLLGELTAVDGRRHDLHVKGSGATPFSRGGDGKAALGPMLREYLTSEAMHALGIPTTRSLAVATTGELVARDRPLPGAVLSRTASSHIRVGTFQYAASLDEPDVVRRLTRHVIARHHPDLADAFAADPATAALELFDRVVGAQAELVARWMLVGFVHGVLNTDNVTVAAETIDYGPCAFMEQVDPATVFSSIDHGGRYAYGNQPSITAWNLARLAESMLTLFHPERTTAAEMATDVLQTFPDRHGQAWTTGMGAKLGLTLGRTGDLPGDEELLTELWPLLEEHGVDLTGWFRSRSAVLRGVGSSPGPESLATWTDRWLARLDHEPHDPAAIAERLDRVNPVYVPRNHLVEEALDAATAGDLVPFHDLVAVVTDPFVERPGCERFAEPAPPGTAPHRTFCGT